VKYIARILVEYDDRPRRVGGTGDGALAYACTCARRIKRGDGTVMSGHEDVIYVARVNVISRNRPRYTDALAERFQLTSALPSSGVMTPIAAERGSRGRGDHLRSFRRLGRRKRLRPSPPG
jgi:hypothetical protein